MASIITRASKGTPLTVPEMDQNLKNLNDQVLRANEKPTAYPILRNDIVNSGVLDPRVSFSRASTGTYFDKYGVMRTAAAGVPRIDYDPVTGSCNGLLVEESRTNVLLNSDTLTNQSVTISASNITLSFYGNGQIVLSGAFSATLVGLGAYPTRTSLTFTPTAGTLTLTITGTVQYSQLEVGSTPTSYIPTTSSQVTRSADVVKIPSDFTSSRLSNRSTLNLEASTTAQAINRSYSSIKSDTTPIEQKTAIQTKNLLTQSEVFSTSPWTVSNTTVAISTQTNPLTGFKTAFKLSDTATNSTHSIYYNLASGLSTTTPYTFSVYVKADGRNYFALRWTTDTTRQAIYNLSTGTLESKGSNVRSTNIRNIGSGWYRISLTVVPTSASSVFYLFTSANNTLANYAGDGTSGTIIYGAQLEADERATKYFASPGYSVSVDGNSNTPLQTTDELKKYDTFAISTDGTNVSYAANSKLVSTYPKTITQISDIVIGADSTELNQINGHIRKVSLYSDAVTTNQLIALSYQ